MVEFGDRSFENAGAGEETLSLTGLAAREDVDAIVLLLQRDYHCLLCRQQVQDVAARHDEFVAENATVVSVVPEPVDRVRNWQDAYDLPYPLLADPEKRLGEAFDQPKRLGLLGDAHDLVGRMPEAVVIDARDGTPKPAFVHAGRNPADRPTVDQLLGRVRELRSHG